MRVHVVSDVHGRADSLATAVRENRQKALDIAYAAHPERFVRRPPTPPNLPKEVWINKPQNSGADTH